MNWKTLTLISLFLWGVQIKAQESDSLGVIGDNLDLYAVLNTFKGAESVEDFEKRLNDPENKVNNIDLNEDDEVDYIRVIDKVDGNAHALILRVDLDESESQDVAAIELEKTGQATATVQIVGDEEIYGEDYIIEPKELTASTKRLFIPTAIAINVWGWPSVQFVFAPGYKPWASPWRWRHYPNWWKPWKPVRWTVYHGHCHKHRTHFRRTTVRRVARAHAVYHKHRRSSKRIQHHRHHHRNVHKRNVRKTNTKRRNNHRNKGRGR